MLDRGLIDLENRPGKRGGAFCTSMPDRAEVRIFCNSTGAASDVRTLLHESGHAFQSWESQWIEAVELRSPSLEACEIHSMGMEFLAYPHLSIFFDAENERKFKRGHLVEAIQFLCYACVVDGFQHEVYAKPGMDADQLADVWRELWAQFMVGEDWTAYQQELGTFWHHKLHIFGLPFYYIDYALAQLCALQLWQLSIRDPANALERYLHLCHLGGTRSFSELVSLAGLDDPFAESTLLNVLDAVRVELGISG
jgi:M3 family oligoendopeptidase